MNHDDNTDKKIFNIDEFRKNHIIIEPSKFSTCFCNSFALNRHNRSVNCSECGKVFDSFDALLKLAMRGEILAQQEIKLKDSIKKKTFDLYEIEKRLKNIKTSLKRAEKSEDLIK